MTQFKDVTVTDLAGAAEQWRKYITDTLGYDYDLTVDVGLHNGKGQVYLRCSDLFQKDSDYSRVVGRLSLIENFALDHDWDAACALVWERLKNAMPRDERELRFGLSSLSGAIEHAPSFTSAIGKMFADRMIAARDELSNHLIEFRRQPAE